MQTLMNPAPATPIICIVKSIYIEIVGSKAAVVNIYVQKQILRFTQRYNKAERHGLDSVRAAARVSHLASMKLVISEERWLDVVYILDVTLPILWNRCCASLQNPRMNPLVCERHECITSHSPGRGKGSCLDVSIIIDQASQIDSPVRGRKRGDGPTHRHTVTGSVSKERTCLTGYHVKGEDEEHGGIQREARVERKRTWKEKSGGRKKMRRRWTEGVRIE